MTIKKEIKQNISKPPPPANKAPATRTPNTTNHTYTQHTLNVEVSNSIQEQDVSILFETPFKPSFITKHGDLSNNSSFDMEKILLQTSKHLNHVLADNTTLDAIYRLTIQSHLIKVLTTKDLYKIKRKAYACMLSYRIFTLLNSTCINLSVNENILSKAKSNFNKILTLLSEPMSGIPLNYVLIEPYDSITQTYLININKNLLKVQGQNFASISNASQALFELVNISLARHNCPLTFDIFITVLLSTFPVTFKHEIHEDKSISKILYITDLHICAELLLKDVPKSFLNKNSAQKKIIVNLRKNFLSLLKIYFCYSVIQNPSNIKKSLNLVFPKVSVSHILKVSDLGLFFKSESLSKNQFSSLTQVIVEMTFDLENILALHFIPSVFSSNLGSLDSSTITTVYEPLIREFFPVVTSYVKEKNTLEIPTTNNSPTQSDKELKDL